MIDTTSENLLSFPEAAASLPDRPHLSTFHRWRQKGVKGVRLETVLIGGRRFTSVQALDRFIQRTTAVADGGHPDGQTLTTDRRRRELDKIDRKLTEAGI